MSELYEAPRLLALLGASPVRPVFWFESPADDLSIAAIGAAAEVRCSGPDRFERGAEAVAAALAGVESDGGAPLAVGGFGFADEASGDPWWRDFPALRFFVPRLLWVREGGAQRIVRAWRSGERTETERLFERVRGGGGPVRPVARDFATMPDPGGRERWVERVTAARDRIRAGALDKVVLSRPRTLRGDGRVDVAALVRNQRLARPGCTGFWFGAEATSFFGSTPELLVRRKGIDVFSGALAGSAPRGVTPAVDAEIGEAFRRCPKNAEEHRLVVEAVRAALAPHVERVEAPEGPGLLRVPEAQHLYTPMRGRLLSPEPVLSLAGALHPTPAVCGVPREPARAWIEREEADRGWYTGGIGWTDAAGEGAIVVALRSAAADGTRIHLRAGAGIVAASDPDAEYAETEAKLGALFRERATERRGRAA